MTDGPMSMESAIEAVKALDAPPPETPEEVQPVENAAEVEETGGEIVSEETVEPAGDAATDEESDEQPAEAVPAVEAPQWWDAEDKAVFTSLTPEQQAVIRKQEDKREAVIQKTKGEAQAAREAARQDIDRAKALADQLAEAIPDQRKQFDAYFKDIDWQAYVAQNPAAAQADYIRYQEGLRAFSEMETQKAEAEKLWRDNFLREESAKLKEIAPELVEKPEALRGVADYLITNGIQAERLADVGALEWSIAHKAMLYDRMTAEAKAKTATPPKIEPKPAARIAPQGAPPARQATSQQRESAKVLNRLRQTKSRDDAAAYLMMNPDL